MTQEEAVVFQGVSGMSISQTCGILLAGWLLMASFGIESERAICQVKIFEKCGCQGQAVP